MKLLDRILSRQGKPTERMNMGGPWAPTHIHKKGGGYRLLGYGINEADRTPVAIYDDADGTVWIRARDQFDDVLRFTPLEK